MSSERHLSSENLLPYSNDLSQSSWTKSRVTVASTNNAAPDGTTTASSLLETTDTDTHTFYDNFNVTSGQQYSYVFYFKANGRTKVSISPQATVTIATVQFDLTAVTSTVTSGSADSHSITAIGATGWYKCAITVTATATGTGHSQVNLRDASGNASYAGDVTKGMFVWGASVSSTGETVLNSTSGSIHREFAPTLKTSQSDQPRFEYSATDGQSEGLLIEQQFTQYAHYSEEFDNNGGWAKVNATVQPNSAVAPDGTLSADLLVEAYETSGTNSHYAKQNTLGSVAVGDTYTWTVFAKAAGRNYATIYTTVGGANTYGIWNLLNGSVTTTSGSGSFSSSDCGNGWYRLQITFTTTTTSGGSTYFYVASDGSTFGYPGNGYGSVLLWGANLTKTASSMSYVKSEASTVTKSADSCSVVSAPLLDNGSGGLVAEYNMFAASDTSYVLHLNKSSGGTNGDGVAITNQYLYVDNNYLNISNTSSATFHKVAASWESGSQKISRDGSAVSEDTSTVVPSGTDKLFIGVRQDGGEPVNGHIRSIAIYSEPLTSTNLTTLSQL